METQEGWLRESMGAKRGMCARSQMSRMRSWMPGAGRTTLDLRRTLASWWLERGGCREALKTWLGHSRDSPMVETIYGRTTPAMIARDVAFLDAA